MRTTKEKECRKQCQSIRLPNYYPFSKQRQVIRDHNNYRTITPKTPVGANNLPSQVGY